MEYTKADQYLKMINDIAKHKPERVREQFRTNLLWDIIKTPKEHHLEKSDIKRLIQEIHFQAHKKGNSSQTLSPLERCLKMAKDIALCKAPSKQEEDWVDSIEFFIKNRKKFQFTDKDVEELNRILSDGWENVDKRKTCSEHNKKEPEMDKKTLKELLTGILEEDRHAIPKVIVAQCGDCRNYILGEVKCTVYPQRIPKDIIENKIECPELNKKEPEMDKETLKELLTGILEEDRCAIPRVEHPVCNECRRRAVGTATCMIYPRGIPNAILDNKTKCQKFERMQDPANQKEKKKKGSMWFSVVGEDGKSHSIPLERLEEFQEEQEKEKTRIEEERRERFVRMAADLFLLEETKKNPSLEMFFNLVEDAKRLNIVADGMTLTELEQAVKKEKDMEIKIRMMADQTLLSELPESPTTKKVNMLIEDANRLNISTEGMSLTDLEKAVKKAKKEEREAIMDLERKVLAKNWDGTTITVRVKDITEWAKWDRHNWKRGVHPPMQEEFVKMEESSLNEPMSLEDYKKNVREWLIKQDNCSIEAADKLMTLYEDDFPEFYRDELEVPVAATAMIMGY